jgi:peptidoglycan hydrolase-like protein with peptidoglycan-binding domain
VLNSETVSGIRAFQRDNGLTTDGRLTEETLARLFPSQNQGNWKSASSKTKIYIAAGIGVICILVVVIVLMTQKQSKQKTYSYYEKKLVKAKAALNKSNLAKARKICESVIANLK